MPKRGTDSVESNSNGSYGARGHNLWNVTSHSRRKRRAVMKHSVMSISNQQNYKQAAAMYQKAIQQKPNVATYRNSLGGAYLMLEQYPKAIEQYQTAIHLKPSEPRFYLNLSKAYELAGAHTEAEKTYKEYERPHIKVKIKQS